MTAHFCSSCLSFPGKSAPGIVKPAGTGFALLPLGPSFETFQELDRLSDTHVMRPQLKHHSDRGGIFRTAEHKGCGIRAASYQVKPGKWVPEAAFWIYTEAGWRQLWLQSFAHCFSIVEFTCANKIEADNWALRMARTVIDRALPEFDRHEPPRPLKTNFLAGLAKLRDLLRRPAVRRSTDVQQMRPDS